MGKRGRRGRVPYYQPPGPRRAVVCALADRPEDVRAAERWLAEHRAALTFVSEDEGCGCCVHSWRVEGPAEVHDGPRMEA